MILAAVENIIIMLLTIVFLIGGAYLALVVLNWAWKLKRGGREDEGLVELWAEAKKEQRSSDPSDNANDDSQP